MAGRQLRRGRHFTGEGHDLHDLLRGEGIGCPRPGRIRQQFDHGVRECLVVSLAASAASSRTAAVSQHLRQVRTVP